MFVCPTIQCFAFVNVVFLVFYKDYSVLTLCKCWCSFVLPFNTSLLLMLSSLFITNKFAYNFALNLIRVYSDYLILTLHKCWCPFVLPFHCFVFTDAVIFVFIHHILITIKIIYHINHISTFTIRVLMLHFYEY